MMPFSEGMEYFPAYQKPRIQNFGLSNVNQNKKMLTCINLTTSSHGSVEKKGSMIFLPTPSSKNLLSKPSFPESPWSIFEFCRESSEDFEDDNPM
jgi:hypothetical protein